MTGLTTRAFTALGLGATAAVSVLLLFVSAALAVGSISVSSPTAPVVGGEAILTVTADAGSSEGLSGWNFSITFNQNDFLEVPSCTAAIGACQSQPGGQAGIVRFADAGAVTDPLTGTVTIGTVDFAPGVSAGSCTDVAITVAQFAGPSGPIDSPSVTGGQVCVEEASESATPTAGPTNGGSPTATATTTAPAGGGGLSGGPNSGVGSLSVGGTGIPAWTVVLAIVGALGLLGATGLLATNVARRHDH